MGDSRRRDEDPVPHVPDQHVPSRDGRSVKGRPSLEPIVVVFPFLAGLTAASVGKTIRESESVERGRDPTGRHVF